MSLTQSRKCRILFDFESQSISHSFNSREFIDTQSIQPKLLAFLALNSDAAASSKTWFTAQESHIRLSKIKCLDVKLDHSTQAATDDDRHLFGHLTALNELTIRAFSYHSENSGMIVPLPLMYLPQTSYHSLTCCILHLQPYVAHTHAPAISIPKPFMGFFDNPAVEELKSLQYLQFSLEIMFHPEVDVKEVEWDPTYNAEWGKLDRTLGFPIGHGGSYIAPNVETFEMNVSVVWPEEMFIGLQRRLRAAFNELISKHGLLEGMTDRFYQDDRFLRYQTNILGREESQGVVTKDGDEYKSAVERCLRAFEDDEEEDEEWDSQEDEIDQKEKVSEQHDKAAQDDEEWDSEEDAIDQKEDLSEQDDTSAQLYGYQDQEQEDDEEIDDSNPDSGELDFDSFGYWGVAGPFDEDPVDDFEESEDYDD